MRSEKSGTLVPYTSSTLARLAVARATVASLPISLITTWPLASAWVTTKSQSVVLYCTRLFCTPEVGAMLALMPPYWLTTVCRASLVVWGGNDLITRLPVIFTASSLHSTVSTVPCPPRLASPRLTTMPLKMG